jgi:hypothetical protein
MRGKVPWLDRKVPESPVQRGIHPDPEIGVHCGDADMEEMQYSVITFVVDTPPRTEN